MLSCHTRRQGAGLVDVKAADVFRKNPSAVVAENGYPAVGERLHEYGQDPLNGCERISWTKAYQMDSNTDTNAVYHSD